MVPEPLHEKQVITRGVGANNLEKTNCAVDDSGDAQAGSRPAPPGPSGRTNEARQMVAWGGALAISLVAVSLLVREGRYQIGALATTAQALVGISLIGAAMGAMLAGFRLEPKSWAALCHRAAIARPISIAIAAGLCLVAALSWEGWRAWVTRLGVWPASVTAVAVAAPALGAVATLSGLLARMAIRRAWRGATSSVQTRVLAGSGIAVIGLALTVGAAGALIGATQRESAWSDEATIDLGAGWIWEQAGVLDLCARPISTLTITGEVEEAASRADSRRFVKRVARSLRPGGRVIVRYDTTSERVAFVEAFVARLAVDCGFRVFRAIRTDREAAMVVGVDAGGWVSHRLEEGYAVREMSVETALRN
ncbi:MAG: hypothetical protein KDA32_04535 [Phycisphaerales bacterium]|nr:hypothetical protein [Phycisphaerales bacterium]